MAVNKGKKNMEEKMKILIARKNATKQKRDSAAESIERMKKYGDLFDSDSDSGSELEFDAMRSK